jgi:TonB family protein
MPEFPAQAFTAGADGVAVARLKLDEQGNVTDVTVLAAPHPAIKEALLAALARWKFKPAKVNDVPTPITSRLTFYYAIDNGRGVVRNPLPR